MSTKKISKTKSYIILFVIFGLISISLVASSEEHQKGELPKEEANFEEVIKEKEKEIKIKEIEKEILKLEKEKIEVINPKPKPEPQPEEKKKEKQPEITTTSTGGFNLNKIEKIDNYINKYSNGSKMEAKDILEMSNKYNIEVRVFLAFAHNESHFGTKGRAVKTNNPYNVGNTDFGDYKAVVCGLANKCLKDVKTGIELFAKLIRNKYLHQDEKGTLEILIERNFIAVRGDVAGKRYMTDTKSIFKYKERLQDLKDFNIDF